ncbi:ArsC/Spx/MgsR family protein [Candidatus Poriferisodalis sp.]|uniref:ArsC/Spx/MgsR family protein n=1 Tax=Candidatus Poriferisodalis sp. TaxID=3101277 RepID=UPI003B016EBC
MEADVVLYMKAPPDRDTLEHLVSILEDPVEDLVRKDSQFKKLNLNADDYVDNPDAVVELLSQRKALMQRPVIVRGNRAIVGRPKGRIAELLAD